jgi:hypothetical protein
METLPRSLSRRLESGATGQLSATELLGGQLPVPRPIDFVFTWVDADDPRWRQMYREHFGGEPDRDRFGSRHELRYALRSVHAYCAWARRIYVVSNCAPPRWLDPSHDRVQWVDHVEIIDAAHLPTFNSHAIEAALPSIPGLSDHFVYCNDDFFVTRPLRPQLFFDHAGRSYAFFEPSGKLVKDRRSATEEPWFDARLAAQRLLRDRFRYAATRFCHHAPFAINKAHCERMYAEFPEEVAATRASRSRSPHDIPLIAFLYGHYAQATGLGLERSVRAQQLKRSNAESFELARDTPFLCINDGGGSATDTQFDSLVERFMTERFPFAAPWERDGRT